MKKYILLFAWSALLAGGCSKDAPMIDPSAEPDTEVAVRFRMKTAVETDTTVEPMTRATNYTNWLNNQFKILILKRVDTRWVVDDTQTFLLDPQTGKYSVLKLSVPQLQCSFALELRQGTYRAVAVINFQSGIWNDDLVQGVTVADDDDLALRTPPLLTYKISDHPANTGYRQLYREVFVAVSDFTVPKSGDLHSTEMPPVELNAERCVGKFRVLLKNRPSPVHTANFNDTSHTIRMLFTAKEKPFPEGIDALGGMYYTEGGTWEMKWTMSTTPQFHPSGSYSYQMCQTNSTVYAPFLFFDPDAGDLPFEISQIRLTGASGGFTYWTDDVFERTLGASKITGIVFQTNDLSGPPDTQTPIGIDEATDDEGQTENAASLFDSFYEWNAEYN